MAIERHFLGWDEPVVTKVRRFLLGDGTPDADALAGLLLLVPTQQSGRRLRQTLASYGAAHDLHLGHVRPHLPIDLVRVPTHEIQVASPLECLGLWSRLLLDVDYSRLTSLFPARGGERGFSWALATGRLVQNLRYQLVSAGLTVRKVATEFQERLEEPERWTELASLEESYLELVDRVGRVDPGEFRLHQARNPQLLEGISRIVLACAPDPEPIALHALTRLAEGHTVQVLVHAPEELAGRFDEWGRPVASGWRDTVVDIPDVGKNLRLAGTPAEQSRLAVSILAEDDYGPQDIGMGVPDSEVVSFLSSEMEAVGLAAYDPDGRLVASHPLFGLIERYTSLVGDGSYASLAAFLRHPDVLSHLYAERGLPTRRLLTDLDQFQNLHLPSDVRDLSAHLAAEGTGADAAFSALATALDYVRSDVLQSAAGTASGGVRSFMQSVFSDRTLSANEPADGDFATVAQHVADLLSEYEDSCVSGLGLDTCDIRTLLASQLRLAHYDVSRPAAAIDLEGWLELHWNDAPFLLVTGMNEGKVPESVAGDPFLPDSLRRQLGLRHDDDRLARDTYLIQALIESRRAHGRACFIAGKTGSRGDPLKPSRLLFNCADADLPGRARLLFGTPESHTVHHAATTSFLLNPSPPADLPPDRQDVRSLAVTGFKDYLSCPFRFYLRTVLGMKPLDDRKKEMDALDFGSLIHEVLSHMAQNDELRSTTDVRALTRYLHQEAGKWMMSRFGGSLPLNLQMQLDAACERLSAVARAQAAEAADGWEIVLVEFPVESTIEGLRVHGRIDRVDRHRETGAIRVLDYKTGDSGHTPEKEHLKNASDDVRDYARVVADGKERQWIDLQLPLYAVMLADQGTEWADAIPGYFNIPGSVDDTRVKMWEGFTAQLGDSAMRCARGVAVDLRCRRFWPPSPRVKYDDFESLFHVEPEKCIYSDSLKEFMGRTE